MSIGPGVVSFVSASSFIDGDAFSGMREYMRRACDEIWVLDLGGDSRGARKSENIFAIKTPVAITIATRYEKHSNSKPAKVYYAHIIEGSKEDKLERLESIKSFADVSWELCPTCLLYTSPSPRDRTRSRMPSSA